MNKVKLVFLIILLISDIYTSGDSECLNKKVSSSRRLSGTLDEEDCLYLETSDTNLMCVLNSDGKSCEEVSKCLGINRVPDLRRLENEDYCEELETSDDNKYLCKLNLDKNICEEVEITCEDKTIKNRRLSGDLTEEYCNSLKAKEDIYYKCVFDSVSEVCKTEEKKCNEVKILNTRRLSTDKLDDEDCYGLETSNDSKICVAKSDGYGCEEINGSNEINLSFSLFFLFLFL